MGEKSRIKQEKRESGITPAAEKSAGSQNSILWWIIFVGTCLISIIPFIVGLGSFFPFVGPKSLYFMLIVEVIFGAWLILAFSSPRYRPRFNTILLALVLFLLVFAASSVLGVDFSRSFWSKYERMTGLLMQLHLFAFFLVVSSTFKRKEDWLKIFGVFSFAAVLMSALSLAPKIGWNVLGKIEESSRGGATLGNSSFLGTYLLLNLFLTIYLFFNTKKTFKIVFGSAAIIIFIALWLSTARAAFLAALFGIILLVLIWLFSNNNKKIKILGIISSLILLICFCSAIYLAFQPGNFINKMVYSNIGETFGGRFVVWQGAWQSFLERPVLGWGPENFEIIFTKHFNPCMFGTKCGGDIWYDRAHNIIFDTLVTTGILGLLSYLGIFVAVFYVLWRKFLKQELSFWAAGIFSVVLISYFIQNLTVFDMINSYMMFFLILAFVGNIAGQKETDESKIDKPINLSFVILVLFLLVPVVYFSFIEPIKSNNYTIKALTFYPGDTERLFYYQKALETSPMGKYQIRDYFAESDMEFVQSQDLTKISVENLKKELAFIVTEMKKSTEESPWDFRSFLKLGQAYNIYAVLQNDPTILSLAETALQKAIELSPTNQQGYWSLAQTELYSGNMQEALSLAQKAQALESGSLQANTILIQVAKIAGQNDLAQQKYQEALLINPEWATSLKSLMNQ